MVSRPADVSISSRFRDIGKPYAGVLPTAAAKRPAHQSQAAGDISDEGTN